MATPNKLRTAIGNKTPYRWLNDELDKHHTIAGVAEANRVTTSAIYKLIKDEELVIIQRVLKNPSKQQA